MGFPTVTAGRILRGQNMGENGESYKTAMEKLDYRKGHIIVINFEQISQIITPIKSGMAKTYTIDFQIPDSAATATSFLSGVKTKFYTGMEVL